MPAVQASLEYLQNLPLYQDEKPYWCFLPPHEGFDPDTQRVDNLEFEDSPEITIEDIRELDHDANIEICGFEVLSNTSKFSHFDNREDVMQYRLESELVLKKRLGAVYVKCYDSRLRQNIPFARSELDLNDPMLVEGPARGAHNDITLDSGPAVIQRYMSEEDKQKYIKPGYRFRIVNTWRTLLPVLQDRPLALCDSRTVLPDDLVPADRVIPQGAGEVYYLTYNPQHKWFWLENQNPSELLIFIMYDTRAGSHARFCPHVSFDNPRAPVGAPPRESMETRSIVITEE
ncbi:hypothetical protein V8E51_004265 [Hyaloscypha variabilis]|jgi:hypothetical protein